MPYLNLKLSEEVDEASVAALAATLTELTATLLHKRREVTALSVETIPAQHWFIGGKSLDAIQRRSFFLDIKITAGSNTPDEKAAYVAETFAAVEAVLGDVDPASYVTIHEVRGDAWGYQGVTQEARRNRSEPPPSIFLSGDYS